MSDIVIKAENLGKQFNIGPLQKYDTLRDRLAGAFRPKGKTPVQKEEDVIWALKDINFEIKQGEVVGVIGRNGAGKSTLLKILSKITEPTVGRVELHGRVGSLLEVGTGFHPELTGRENVYLNGAILGMKRQEIKRRFDEIVAFSEVEKFIDTPVKHYSSGMYMRLAFAVAAHLDPEILLVDEVLAVGDAQFQNKCLGKMGEVAKGGRTILFVSHNMGAIMNLCTNAIYLNNGNIISYDLTNKVIDAYLKDTSDYKTDNNIQYRNDRKGDQRVVFTKIDVKAGDRSEIKTGDKVDIILKYRNSGNKTLNNVNVALGIDDIYGQRLVTLWSKYNNQSFDLNNKEGIIKCEMPQWCFKAGTYYFHLYIEVNGIVSDYVHNAYRINVENGKYYKTGLEPVGDQGCMLYQHNWQLIEEN